MTIVEQRQADIINNMVRSKRFWLLISLGFVLATFGFAWQQVWAQSENSRYFPETGHWVTGEFLVMYESIPNPTLLFGVPITEAFEDTFGTKIQYFEKVRFELDPSMPSNVQVKLSPLGEYLYQEGKKLDTMSSYPACHFFVETGHAVCYAFLNFFDTNGGINQFGYPISGLEDHDGRIVQYFQKARFEWHPENQPGQWVTVSNLGFNYFHHRGEDPKLLSPELNEIIPSLSVLELHPRAFVKSSILTSGEKQKIFVIVQDQNYRPVPNAKVEFKVTWPDGKFKSYMANDTNEVGVSTLDFEVGFSSPGIANIEVSVSFNTLEEQTRTSFHIWW